ncbi:transcription cofactor vestigial-like protein 2b [Trichomycterus rosablanca]|uniref:transcription cofactor vestigial-like protein 2b n=1 Tax=Trichomycterus rosablanca TaxID=2290929 RepID=UPI002F354009
MEVKPCREQLQKSFTSVCKLFDPDFTSKNDNCATLALRHCLAAALPLPVPSPILSSTLSQIVTGASSPASRHKDLMDASGAEGVPVLEASPISSSYSSARPKEKQAVGEAEYLSSRCVLFTYYQGDISSVVDEHFSRALSSCTEVESKRRANHHSIEPKSPNSRRSFPPSFWDSNYPPLPSRPHREPTGTPAFPVDPYSQTLHTGLSHAHPHPHPSDSWGFTQSQVYGPPRPLHELYSPPGLEAHYSPLLMPAVRPPHLPGHYDMGKLEPTHTWPGLLPPGDVALALNMDPGLQPHKKGKELYWF